MNGILYLIPSTLGESPVDYSVPPHVKQLINSIDCFLVESEKAARRFLIKAGYNKPIENLDFRELNEHTREKDLNSFLEPLLAGKNMGVISDAGCPAVADPGAEVVLLAHYRGIRVVPMVGASSIMLALMSSGLNGQKFCFHGYLPAEREPRIKKIKEIEKESGIKNQTQVFIEAPYRNQKLLEDVLQHCTGNTLLCIACDLTLPTEFISTKSIKDWKKNVPGINKRPVVFLLQS